MRTREIKRQALAFREGLLAGGSSNQMCFAVCAPLQGWLSVLGVDTELLELELEWTNHYVLRLSDGRILDPTADQFGREPVYIGPNPYVEIA